VASGEEKYTHDTRNRTPVVQPVASNSMNTYTYVCRYSSSLWSSVQICA